MLKAFALLSFSCFAFSVKAQDAIKKYVLLNASAITSIEPENIDYADLDIIGNAIGDARIVMLGEQDHGDAPTFLAKTRLIKYLHEKKGFNVLAFESDFFGLNPGYDQLVKNKTNVDLFLRNNIFPVWTYCNTCQNLLYNYIPSTYATENPLFISGFDNQMVLDYSAKHLVSYIDSLLKAMDISLTKQDNYATLLLPLIDSVNYWSVSDTGNYSKRATFLSIIKQQVAGKLSENSFEMQVINNLVTENAASRLFRNDARASGNIRDQQMASNIKWLAEVKFPKQKIIVWAANAHVAKYADTSRKDRSMIAMGSYLIRDPIYFGNAYVIGFTSHEGEAGRLGFKTYAVRKSKPNGFENRINKSYKYAFVDFKNYHKIFNGKPESFYMKGLAHNTAFEKDWSTVFDGIFFIREMYPCKR